MAMHDKSGHKDKVNKLFTIWALAFLPCPALAAGAALPATVAILSPTADVHVYDGNTGHHHRHGLALQGQSGQVIRYTAGKYSGLVVLGENGAGSIDLPKPVAANAEYMLHYD
jgi:hypothetical protein